MVGFAPAARVEGAAEDIASPVPESPRQGAPAPAPEVGDSLAEIRVHRLHGGGAAHCTSSRPPVLLVNWSPFCGFCTKIAGQLGELEPPLRDEDVELVFLTMGDEEPNARGVGRGCIRAPRCCCVPRVPVIRSSGPARPPLRARRAGRVATPMVVGADRVPRLARDLAGVDAPDGSAPSTARASTPPGAVCGPGGGAGGAARTAPSGRGCARMRSASTTWV